MRNCFLKLSIVIMICLCGVSQKASSQFFYNLEYEDFNVFFRPKKCLDTIDFKLSGKYLGFKLRLYLKDCRGEAHFELFDKKNELRIKGNYDNSIDTLKKYKFGRYLGEPEGTEKYRVSAIQYLYPLKVGEWQYYKGYGKQKKRRTIVYNYSTD